MDLAALVDVQRDSVAGTWTTTAATLSVEPALGARLVLPWRPPRAYDLEVSFIRHTGSDSIALIFTSGTGRATFDIDGWNEGLAGIQNIAGRTMRDNATRVPEQRLVNGRRYTAMLRVRPDRVEAWLDGRLLTTYRGDGGNLSLLDLWQMPDGAGLGLGAWNSQVTFEQVRIRPAQDEPAAVAPVPVPPPVPVAPVEPPAPGSTISPAAVASLDGLSDEFTQPKTLENWRQLAHVEQSEGNPLLRMDIGRSRKGWLTLVPHTSTWYQDYRGVLLFKPVEGDFVVTTKVRATRREGDGPPRSAFSLAGIMVRSPRDVTPATWQPGGENYIFLSLGAAREPGRFAFEVKTTQDSRSDLEIEPAPGPEATIRVARIGADFYLLRRVGAEPWMLHRRYRRPDMPATLQVGMTVYTDYEHASRLSPAAHNQTVIRDGRPDLVASFDFFRFRRLTVTEELRDRQLSEVELLTLLGE